MDVDGAQIPALTVRGLGTWTRFITLSVSNLCVEYIWSHIWIKWSAKWQMSFNSEYMEKHESNQEGQRVCDLWMPLKYPSSEHRQCAFSITNKTTHTHNLPPYASILMHHSNTPLSLPPNVRLPFFNSVLFVHWPQDEDRRGYPPSLQWLLRLYISPKQNWCSTIVSPNTLVDRCLEWVSEWGRFGSKRRCAALAEPMPNH